MKVKVYLPKKEATWSVSCPDFRIRRDRPENYHVFETETLSSVFASNKSFIIIDKKYYKVVQTAIDILTGDIEVMLNKEPI